MIDILEGLYKIYFAPEDKREDVKTDFVTTTGRDNLKVHEITNLEYNSHHLPFADS